MPTGERCGVKAGVLIGDERSRSEADAWMIVRDHARFIQEQGRGAVKDHAGIIEVLADRMIAQLRQGIHANPGLSYRVNFNGQEVLAEFAKLKDAREWIARHYGSSRAYFVERRDPDTGEWFPVSGTRANPDLAVMALGANPPRGESFGQDVLGIVYQHEDDPQGERRVHLFGKGGQWRETRGGRGVELYNLPAKTGVFMEALGDKKVVLAHRRDLPLVGEF